MPLKRQIIRQLITQKLSKRPIRRLKKPRLPRLTPRTPQPLRSRTPQRIPLRLRRRTTRHHNPRRLRRIPPMPILRPLRNRTLNPHPEPPTPQKKPGPASRHPTHGAQPLNQPKGERGKPAQKPRPAQPLTRRPPRRNPHTTHTPTPTQPHQPPPRQAPTQPSPKPGHPTPPRKCANTHSNNPHTSQGGRQSDHTPPPNSSPTRPRQEPFPATKPKAPKGRSPESAKSADRVVLFKGFKVLNFLNRTVQTSLPRTLLRTVPGTVPEQFPELFEPFPYSENAYTSSPTSNAEKEIDITPKSGVNTASQGREESSQSHIRESQKR